MVGSPQHPLDFSQDEDGMPEKPTVILSHSSQDKDVAARLLVNLKPLQKRGVIELWSDDGIEKGAKWHEEIAKAINNARVAILLVSADFMGSDYVQTTELPLILSRQMRGELTVLVLFVSHSLAASLPFVVPFDGAAAQVEVLLTDFQGFGSSDKTLRSMAPDNQEAVLSELAKYVMDLAQGQRPIELPPGRKDGVVISDPPVFKKEDYRDGETPASRVQSLGLVDVGLQLGRGLTWKHLPCSIDELIDRIPRGGEYFIVARSLEKWLQPSGDHTGDHIQRLAKHVVSNEIKCTLVLPDEGVRSLVLSDESQSIGSRLWSRLKASITNGIRSAGRDPDAPLRSEMPTGVIEVYTIPAYVPSTFSRVASRDGTSYCSLEVGIGVPPGGDRLLFYFEDNGRSPNAYKLLATIHRGLIDERKPVFSYPPAREPEDSEALREAYDAVWADFSRRGCHASHRRDNGDWWSQVGRGDYGECMYEENRGTAVAIATPPVGSCLGGSDLLKLAQDFRRRLSELVRHQALGEEAVRWYGDDELFVGVFDCKSTFKGPFVELSAPPAGQPGVRPSPHRDERGALVSILSACDRFTIRFTEIQVDAYGRILLLGIPDTPDSVATLSKLRWELATLAKVDQGRHDARRPRSISCVLGLVNAEPGEVAQRALTTFVEANRYVAIPPTIEIDQLRLVRLEGTFAKHKHVQRDGDGPFVLRSRLLDGDIGDYGTMARGKWLAHDQVFNAVKRGAFRSVSPVTVHLAPSLDCDYGCPTCSYGRSKTEAGLQSSAKMERDQLFRAIDLFSEASVRGVILTGGGEPLTHPDAVEAMRYAKKIGLSVGLFTNGLRLDSQSSLRLLTSRLAPDFVRISINAGTREAYRLVHGCDARNFDIVLANLADLCQAKLRNGVATRLDVGVLITPAMGDGLIDLAIEIKRLALHYPGALGSVLLRPAVNYTGGNRQNTYTTELTQHVDYGSEYREFFGGGSQFQRATFEKALAEVQGVLRGLLATGGTGSVEVGFPSRRFEMASAPKNRRAFGMCHACSLVAFVAPDTSVYRCVEQALGVSPSLGRLSEVERFEDLWTPEALGRWEPNLDRCPPVCLLYETNEVWENVGAALREDGGPRQRVLHDLELAREHFVRHAAPQLGSSVNFI